MAKTQELLISRCIANEDSHRSVSFDVRFKVETKLASTAEIDLLVTILDKLLVEMNALHNNEVFTIK